MKKLKNSLSRALRVLACLLFAGNSTLSPLAVLTPLPAQSGPILTQPLSRAISGPATVSIQDLAFVPDVITITVGSAVTWINNDSTVHQVKSGRPHRPTNVHVYLPIISHGLRPSPTPAVTPTPPSVHIYLPTISHDFNLSGEFLGEKPEPEKNVLQTVPGANPTPNEPRSRIVQSSSGGNSLEAVTWDSGRLDPGESFSITLEAGGVYDYYNPLHPEMTGQVVVALNLAPVVTILTPEEGAVVGATVLVAGAVTDDGNLASVLVNDVPATLSGSHFEATITLESGNQVINAVAEDSFGASGMASRLVSVDESGPMITVHTPKDRQSVYTLNPTLAFNYTDFYSGINPASLSVILTGENGAQRDVTGDLSITDAGASGAVSAALVEDTTYTMTVILADTLGNLGNEAVSFYVPTGADHLVPPDEPPGAGWVSGVVYDSNTCNEDLTACQGLAGAKVTLAWVETEGLDAVRAARQQQLVGLDYELPLAPMKSMTFTNPLSGTVITGPDGFFTFPAGETGHYWLRAEKEGYTYGQREIDIVRKHSTATNNLYLTRLDPAITPCDDTGCSHTNSDNTLQLTIPPGAIPPGQTVAVNATNFEQVEFLPSGGLPPGTWETYAFNLGGASELSFTIPITVQVANSLGFAPGTPVPVGYWNQATQAWEHAGTGIVDPSGEWVVLQVTHFSNYDCNDPITVADPVSVTEDQTEDDKDECEDGEGGCFINLRSGEFEETVVLPTVNVLGEAVAPQLVYNSSRVNPSEVIDIKLTVDLDPSIEWGDEISFELYIEGQKTDSFTFANPIDRGELGRFRYLWDGRDASGNRLPPGVYAYKVRLSIPYTAQYCYALAGIFGNPPDCLNGATGVFVAATRDIWTNGTVVLNPQVQSPFGAGFVLDGMQRLTEDEAGHILVADSQRSDEFYFPYHDFLTGQSGITNTEGVLAWTNQLSNNIQTIPENLAMSSEDADIPLGREPTYIALSPDGALAYVTNYGGKTVSVVDLALPQEIDTIGVGNEPSGLALSPGGALAYVANYTDGNLSVLDLALRQQIAAIGLGRNISPREITLSPGGAFAYVTNSCPFDWCNNISVVDLSARQEIARITVGSQPWGIALSPDGAFAYVTNNLGGTVSIVDLALRQEIGTVGVGTNPRSIAIVSDGTLAYVANNGSSSISVVDLALQQEIATIGVGAYPQDITLSPDETLAYVTNSGNGTISVVDLALRQVIDTIYLTGGRQIALSLDGTLAYLTGGGKGLSVVDLAFRPRIARIGVGRYPQAITLAPDGGIAYVTNVISNTMSVVDLANQQEVAAIRVGSHPGGIAITPDEKFAYVTNYFDNNVSVIDLTLQQQVATIGVGDGPEEIVLSPDGVFAYVTNYLSNSVSVVDLLLQQVVYSIGVGNGPRGIALTPDGTFAYVTSPNSLETVSIVDLALHQQVGTLAARYPRGIAISLDGALAYVTNFWENKVSVMDLDLRQQVASIDVGWEPLSIAISPGGGFAYVANSDKTISVVDLALQRQVGMIRMDLGPSRIAVSGVPTLSSKISSRTATDYSTLTYLASTQSYSRTYPAGEIVHFNPDGSHDFTLEPDGQKTTYTYNPDGSLATVAISAPGETSPRWVWRFNYENGKLESILDPAGRLTTFMLDRHGNLVKATTPDGAAQGFAYNPDHLVTHYTGANGAITAYLYDAYGRIARVVEPAREIYDSLTGQTTVKQEVKRFTPSDTGYPLINASPVGAPGNPAPPVPLSAQLVDKVEYGQGERSGHTNKWGRWLDETDGLGRTTFFQYDDENNLTRTDFPDNDCVAITYDEHGNTLTKTNMNAAECAHPGSGLVQTWTYTYADQFDHLKTVTDPKGNTTTYIYDYEEGAGSAGKLIRVEHPQVQDENGQWVTPMEHYTYNRLGLVETKTDARGTVTRYEYTPQGWLSRVIEDDGELKQTTTYQDFNPAGYPQAVLYPSSDGLSRVVHYTYDAMNRVNTETDALGNATAYTYDGPGNILQKVVNYTGADGQFRSVTTLSTYNPNNQLTSEYTAAGGLVVGTWNTYDINGNLSTVTDGNGHTTHYLYDDAGQKTRQTDPAGYTTVYTYSPDGSQQTIADGRGKIRKYVYDGLGRLVSEIHDFGDLNLTTNYTYDLNGNRLTQTDPVGTVTRYGYDALNRRTLEVRDETGFSLTKEYAYDLNNNRAKVTDARGSVTLMRYDAFNRLFQAILDANGLGLVTTYQYNRAGNLQRLTDERGVVTYYEYDALNRQVLLRQDENGLALDTSFSYDGLGNLVMATGPDGVTTRTEYNYFGVPVQEIGDNGGIKSTTTYTYDNHLNLIGITDANGNVTTHTYEERDLLATTTYADKTTVVNTYDENGNLATWQDQSGNLIHYTYDGTDRLVSRAFPGGNQAFTYDEGGRMTSAGETANGHTTRLTWRYNPLGDIENTTQTLDGVTYTVGYSYDYVVGTATTTYPTGAQVTHALDALSRVEQVTKNDSPLANYAYDDRNGLYILSYANDAATQTETNALGQITRKWTHTGTNTWADYRYDYNDAGNLSFIQHAHQPGQPADVYQYDGLQQLTQVWYGANATDPSLITAYDHLQWYDLDGLGNRLEVQNDGVPEVYLPNDGEQLANPMNRYEKVNTAPFAYDLRGNTLADGRNTYAYDLMNRQIGMVGPGGNAEYVYDALGRRVAKIVDGVTTGYVFDTQYRVLEERNGDRTLAAAYTYGAGIDEVLTMERGGNTYYYHRDAQTSITEITDAAGTLVERYTYDVYGAASIFDPAGNPRTASAIGNPYLYTARHYDSESGNYYFRARMYSPWIGRFLQMDPLSDIDGMNFYASYFVLNGVDPFGLAGTAAGFDFTKYLDLLLESLLGFTPKASIVMTVVFKGSCCCGGEKYTQAETKIGGRIAIGDLGNLDVTGSAISCGPCAEELCGSLGGGLNISKLIIKIYLSKLSEAGKEAAGWIDTYLLSIRASIGGKWCDKTGFQGVFTVSARIAYVGTVTKSKTFP